MTTEDASWNWNLSPSLSLYDETSFRRYSDLVRKVSLIMKYSIESWLDHWDDVPTHDGMHEIIDRQQQRSFHWLIGKHISTFIKANDLCYCEPEDLKRYSVLDVKIWAQLGQHPSGLRQFLLMENENCKHETKLYMFLPTFHFPPHGVSEVRSTM